MDAQQQVVWNAEISAAVLGNAAGHSVVIDLDRSLPSDLDLFKQHGFTWCGVMAYSNGQCSASCELTVEAMSCLASAAFQFAQLVAARLKRGNENTAWLERLYQLPDTRDN
jgi:hypothetical protein